ncbi:MULTISPECIES: DUF2177 family protein [Altererythrobacter]|uniref:Putative membrane protein n=1 Tax=Altererythrobacter ishigakiensis TaxID=476157 RepID=A0A562UWI4_9SPHN|nr:MULTISPECIES: DUF2177 family protein [Altererythrobacter]MBO6609162.1 DUF2177 family protein [Altererythrobacter sp.]MBO6641311.1 DUF2177 family protein [Altererythrobacter sp.]MBO6707991.1 DUF2177 family protein [Altererythrobacter sp.]MBO6945877.1 DUF2177 family protein [Altererythrobacter sp.]MDX1704165.1 DUF2177 family protein [Altererythrobacter ishigakiensis]
MIKWVIAYVSAAIAFGVLDAIWLRWAGPNLYEPVIGGIMADNFRVVPAAAFYTIYLAGMCWFAIRPGLDSGQVGTALINGAILGAVCYATFDLTSQAVFKVWATHISVADIAWGTFVTGTSAAIATWITLKFSG